MKKIIVLVACIVGCTLAFTKINTTYTPVPGAVISSSGTKANTDTLKNGINRIVDTLNNGVPRWKSFQNHDSTFRWMNIDTVKGPVIIDSIKSVDTIYIKNAKIDKVDSLGNLNIKIKLTAKTGVIDTLSGSVFNGASAAFTLPVSVDSLWSLKGVMSPRFYGPITGNVTGTSDSAKGAHHLSGGSVSATTGLYSGTVSVDSLFSTKGIKFGGVLSGTADSSKGTHHLNGGQVSADSVYSVKGITGTKINTGLGNFEVGQNLDTLNTVVFGNINCKGYLKNEPAERTIIYPFDTTLTNGTSVDLGAIFGYSGTYYAAGWLTILSTRAGVDPSETNAYISIRGNIGKIMLQDTIPGTSYNVADSTTSSKINIYTDFVTGNLRMKNNSGYTQKIGGLFVGKR